MPRRGKPVTLAPGVYAFRSAFRVTAKVGDVQHEATFPRDTELHVMQRWQLTEKAKLLGKKPTRAPKQSLAGEIPTFLATMAEGSKRRRDFELLLNHWARSPLGARPRRAVTKTEIMTQLAVWEAAGVAASTRNHRLRALRAVYNVLDAHDDDAVNPAAKVQKAREPEPEARAISYDLIEAILSMIQAQRYAKKLTPVDVQAIRLAAAQPGANRRSIGRTHGISETMVRKIIKRPSLRSWNEDAKTRARLTVMAYTGLPPAQLMRLKPDDVDVTAKTIRVTPRRKGKGVKARTLPLLDEAVVALEEFARVDAWGTFSVDSARHSWNRAKKRLVTTTAARTPKPSAVELAQLEAALAGVKPYDLRHSFATSLLRSSGSLKAVKELLLHADTRTTERYIGGAVDDVARAALATWRR